MEDQFEEDMDVEFTARAYQEELFEKACQGNTIICLKTGAGKTFIAIMLIKSLQHEVKVPYKENGKRTFFLVPKVPLVKQQAYAIRTHTILNVGEYCGANGVDAWTKQQWEKELSKNEVMVMTAQILVNMLRDGYINLSRVNLIVFDECHIATGKSPYCAVMARYRDFNDRPRILGLTASILNKKCKPCRVEQEMKLLEGALCSRIVSADNLGAVNQFATKPKEMIIVCPPGESTCTTEKAVAEVILQGLNSMKHLLDLEKEASTVEEVSAASAVGKIQNAAHMADIMEILKKLWENQDASDVMEFCSSPDGMLKYISGILQILGLWCTKTAVDNFLAEVPSMKKNAQGQLQLNKVALFDILESRLSDIQRILARHFQYSTKENAIVQSISPRVRRLIELLSALGPGKVTDHHRQNCHEFRGIIFVEQRIIAWALTDYLMELAACIPDTFGYLHACYIVGHGVNIKFLKKSSMNVNQQSIVLHGFRTGSTNLMVATQVVEEGLDIPKCNAVIRFDPPKNFTSYVQSMGRARAEKALYVLLVDPVEKPQLIDDITVYKMVECILNLRSHNRDMPTDEDFDDFLEDYNILPPYYTTTTEGAAITVNTALEILIRYCNSLPHDRYTHLGPKYTYMRKQNELSKVCCSIALPFGAIGLMREPVVGPFMDDKKLARKAAAYYACIRLHREGELNDNLMPAVNFIQRYSDQLGIVPLELCPGDAVTPGTKKRKRVYDKKVADDLSNAFPSHERSYLYAICFDAKETDETMGSLPCYGILTSKPMSDVPPFTLYGKKAYTVTLQCLTPEFKIDQRKLKVLEEFHSYLFKDVLHLATEAMEFCPKIVTFSLLIVPLKLSRGSRSFIDWELIISCQDYINNMETDNEHFTDLPSKGVVVLPQYGDAFMKTRRFYVQNVCYELSPDSPFGNSSGYTYADYLRLKYGIQVLDHEQPLLLVDYIPNTLNLLHPQSDKKTARTSRRLQHLIPEMCKIYPLNIRQVSQAFFVPSTLHRLNGLLLAKQLTDQIITEANLPLEIDAPTDTLRHLEALCRDCKIRKETIFSPYGFLADSDSTILGALIFQALTTSSADNWSDLERLEVVGDSFLKFAISVFLFCTITSVNEGGLSTLRTGLVKNFNLFSHSRAKAIPQILNATMFQPRLMWLPPGFHIPECLRQALLRASVERHLWPHATLADVRNFAGADEDWVAELISRWAATNPAVRETVLPNPVRNLNSALNCSFEAEDDDCEVTGLENSCDYYTQQLMGDKTIADAAEAIIGAVLLSCGQDAALRFINWLGLKVLPDSYPWTLPETALIMTPPPNKLSEIYVGLDELENRLGYTFKEKSFLRQALIHPSYIKEPVTDNYQRLEFLGDAILDFLVTMNLYKMHPDLSPGDMTDLRSSLVDNITFGYLSVKNDLHKHLKYSSNNLFQVIDRYIKHTENMEHPKDAVYLIKEDETMELEEVEIPKALGDVFEAIAGAIFIDSGLSLEAVWNAYYPMMKDSIDKYSVTLPINPIRLLLEKFPQTVFGKPVNQDGKYSVEVICNGETFVGVSRKKTFAKQAAAKSALRAFKIPASRIML